MNASTPSVEHNERATPVIAVGLETSKPPLMLASRGRTLRHHALMYILDGTGFFEDAGLSRRRVVPGTVLYLYPGQWHWFDPDPGTVWTEYWVLFDGEETTRRFGSLLPPSFRPIHVIGRDDAIVDAYEELYGAWLHGGREYVQHVSFLLHRILFGAFKAIEGIRAPHPDDLVHQARETIQRRLGDAAVNFKRLAASRSTSYERFRKKFKVVTGSAPKQYHLMAKVNRARERLLRPDLSVKEIAAELGFADQLYFSRLFKRKTGLSPLQYRRRCLSGPSPASEPTS